MELLGKEQIQQVTGDGISWQDAITLSAKPLLDKKLITTEYINSVISICLEKGPYMNIGPQIVLAHARPLSSTKQACISLLKTTQEVSFIDNKHPARLWFFLATPDNTSHVAIMQQLASVLLNADKVQQLLAAVTIDDLANVFSGE
ncbi:PTS sugar transporter subunit IIA [Pectinatus brassicae]|uniref:Ascorbate-specific PTS system EIIA component n=1 Tax=Pectinatus brassicae TaxID=862415 RepID=A0A840UP37_9FIRM|nr:PTS sugar transporter subunit IIA [Pectinatus brassicae]MBB5335972.1 PTS system ascorbate-specific IIA component [Pectinatus brassicae]